jgi:hypothetical protein
LCKLPEKEVVALAMVIIQVETAAAAAKLMLEKHAMLKLTDRQ